MCLYQKRRVEMKKKIILFLSVFCICLCLTGCYENERDFITISNKSDFTFDNVAIPTKNGYFYDFHEKFKVDDNTIAITIYFTKEDSNGVGGWDEPQTECER